MYLQLLFFIWNLQNHTYICSRFCRFWIWLHHLLLLLLLPLKESMMCFLVLGLMTKILIPAFFMQLYLPKILTYADDRLERGKTVPPGLMQAIKNSKISVIIFSDNYASATWILVLRRILGGMKYKGQIIKSLSYYEDRSHVQERPGTFGQFIERFKQSSKGVSYNTG